MPEEGADAGHRTAARGFTWLVAANLLLACAPAAYGVLPADIRFLPLMLALASITIGQTMLLGFWAGMGLSRLRWRVIGALLGGAYLALWATLGGQLWNPSTMSFGGFVVEFRRGVLTVYVMIALVAASFFLVRRWFSELRVVTGDEAASPGKIQYSIFSLLVITTVAALLLGLARAAHRPENSDWLEYPAEQSELQEARVAHPADESGWRTAAATILPFACLLIDVLCAVWATLGTGRIRWRLAVVFVVAALLGLLESITMGSAALAWWLVPGWILASLVLCTVIVASLLVVRARGYRLVARRHYCFAAASSASEETSS